MPGRGDSEEQDRKQEKHGRHIECDHLVNRTVVLRFWAEGEFFTTTQSEIIGLRVSCDGVKNVGHAD
jgi:hypothetical protein